MPHIIVKLWPGKSDKQKRKLAEEITLSVMTTLHYGEESVSVAFEEIEAKDWASQVYRTDILGHEDELYKNPATRCKCGLKYQEPLIGDAHGNQEIRNSVIH